jgi:hypothetical protein
MNVRFRAFCWSGRNTNSDRVNAASALRLFVRKNIETWPKARHYLVCHSHGGTVALYALNDVDFAKLLAGVITLSTPFVYAERRPLPSRLISPVGDGREFKRSWFFLDLLAFSWLPVIMVGEAPEPAGTVIIIGTVLFLVLFCTELLWESRNSRKPILPQRMGSDFERQILPDLRMPETPPCETLIVRAPHDEATGVLTAFSFLAWLSMMTWRLLTAPIKEIRSAHRRAISIASRSLLYLGTAGAFISEFVFENDHAKAACILGAAAGLGGYLGARLDRIAIALSSIPFSAVCWLSARLFGPEVSVRDSVLWRFSAEASPPGGPWNIYTARSLLNRDIWAHFLYNDPDTIAKLGSWMRSSYDT